jgi:WhiB family transcriptional regulator, redox-sensing transcriptional regulator
MCGTGSSAGPAGEWTVDLLPQRAIRQARNGARAKAVCEQCEGFARYRQYAIDAAEPYGTWGGMTELERALHTPHIQLTGQSPGA